MALGLVLLFAGALAEEPRPLSLPPLDTKGCTWHTEARRARHGDWIGAWDGFEDLDPDRKAERMFRLAALYLDEADALRQQAVCDGAPVDAVAVAGWATKAAKLCQAIRKAYPGFARVDEATVLLGMALHRAGRAEEAVAPLAEALARWPGSPWAAAAASELSFVRLTIAGVPPAAEP